MDRLPHLKSLTILACLYLAGCSPRDAPETVRVVAAPCMTLEEVETRSVGFKADVQRYQVGGQGPLIVGSWDQLEVPLTPHYTFKPTRGSSVLHLAVEQVGAILHAEEYPMADWNHIARLVEELEAEGFSTQPDEKTRALEHSSTSAMGTLGLLKGDLQVRLFIEILDQRYVLYTSIAPLYGCGSFEPAPR